MSGLSAKEFVDKLSTNHKVDAVFFVYSEINPSIIGVLTKFYTKAKITLLSGIAI